MVSADENAATSEVSSTLRGTLPCADLVGKPSSSISAAIPGTTKLHRLEENLGAVNLELSSDDLRKIDEAASEIDVQGARYPEKLEAMTGR